jgi:2-dehydro-3-deoxyglucarate aldolase
MNRKEAIQDIRDRLRSGGVSIGSWMQIAHPSVAEIMGQAGYDWVAVDMEHGSISHHQLPDLFRALELGNTLPLVRLAEGSTKECKQALDAGAGGVIVPMMESASQLLAVRDACRWPPAGTRGVGFSRANLFGKHFTSYQEEAQAPLLVAMIEHITAVDELEEMLKVDGLDAILIGPYDLSASMNLTGQFEKSEFRFAMAKILEKANAAHIAAGVHVVNSDSSELHARMNEGFRFLPYAIDSIFLVKGTGNPLIK